MLPFENMVADYIKETGNHVLYRVTPVFADANLVSDGVLMEGYSVEDEGAGICYCVFAHNVQPGVVIDYGVGISWLEDGTLPYHSNEKLPDVTYVGNTKSFKFHAPDCPGLDKMSDSNKVEFYGNRQEVIDAGYEPCGICSTLNTTTRLVLLRASRSFRIHGESYGFGCGGDLSCSRLAGLGQNYFRGDCI